MILEILIGMALLFVFAVFALALCSFVLIQIWKLFRWLLE